MNDESSGKLGGGLVYSDTIPLAWRERGQMPDGAALARLSDSSLQVLRLLLTMDEQHSEPTDDSDFDREELARLEFKLNLLIDLVGQLLIREAVIPAPVPISLAAHGIEWMAESAPPPRGSSIEIELYLSAVYPRPVLLPGYVESAETTADGTLVRVIFPEFREPLQDALEKFIFRRHRRIVAHARRAAAQAAAPRQPESDV